MTDRRNVTGVWYGRYHSSVYPQENGFIALLEESGEGIEGSITEPDDESDAGIRRATVLGTRDGANVSFIKQYDGSGGWDHSVHYSGMVDAEGTEISGMWFLDLVHGSFVMEREKFDASELENEEEILLDAPVGSSR